VAILSFEKKQELELHANALRETIIEMLLSAGSGHTAGALGMADIFTALYFHTLRHDPHDPAWPARDRVVLSNGHICPVLYAVMAHAGYFPVEETKTLRTFGSRLQGHPHREWLPALETSSGPLGSGLSQAVGMALAHRIDRGAGLKDKCFFYALVSDGEHDSGNFWEAALLAGKNKLDELIVIIDRNNIQIDGFTEDVMPLEPLADKWKAFNFHVQEINGHDFEAIVWALNEAKRIEGKPHVIIAHTIPGKGVKEFENKYEWHGKPPNKAEAAMAINELRTLGNKIRSEHQ
jgi:transketolase